MRRPARQGTLDFVKNPFDRPRLPDRDPPPLPGPDSGSGSDPMSGEPGWPWLYVPIVMAGGVVGSLVGFFIVWLLGIDQTVGLFWVALPLQNLTQFGLLWAISLRRGGMAAAFGFALEPRHIIWMPVGLAVLISLGALSALLQSLLGITEDNPQAILRLAGDLRGTPSAAAVFVTLGVMGPIVEEVTFRGLALRTGLHRGMSPAKSVLLSAAIFTAAHLVDPALFGPRGLVVLTMFFLLGLLLGFLTVRFRSLGPAIFVHSGFNLTSLALLFWTQSGG